MAAIANGCALLDSVEIVAHRAGNTIDDAARAVGTADLIELDVHVFRGRVEVRHEKVLWPTRRLWERWYLLPAFAEGVALADVLEVLGPGTPVLVDLKCFTRRAVRRVLRTLPVAQPIVVSTRSWWVLRPFAKRPLTRRLRSCGSGWQLWLAQRMPGLGPDLGVAVHDRLLDRGTVESLRGRTNLVFCWAVTSRERCLELVGAGVTGLILDDVRLACP